MHARMHGLQSLAPQLTDTGLIGPTGLTIHAAHNGDKQRYTCKQTSSSNFTLKDEAVNSDLHIYASTAETESVKANLS